MSVIVPLCAAAIGATAGGLARYVLDWQAQRAEFQAAVWVMGDDLARLSAHLRARPMGSLGHPDYPSPEGDAWTLGDRWQGADRRVLAQGLRGDLETWGSVRRVLFLAPELHRAIQARADRERGDPLDMEQITRTIMLDDDLTAAVTDALERLGRHAGRRAKRERRRQERAASKTTANDAGEEPNEP